MRAPATPSARKERPASPFDTSPAAITRVSTRPARRRRIEMASTNTTRNPNVRRKTTSPYRDASARSGRNAIRRRPMPQRSLTLWRRGHRMPDVDRLAALQINHLARVEPRRPDGPHLPRTANDDLVSGSNFRRRVRDADSEDVPLRDEILNLHPIGVGLGEDRAALEGQRQHPAPRMHRDLTPVPDHADIRESTAEGRPFGET